MSPRRLGLTQAHCIVGLLSAGLFFSTACPASAETSVHRLHRKLHKLEKKTGKALDRAGDKLGEIFPRVEVDYSFGFEEIIDLLLDSEASDCRESRTPSKREAKPKSQNHLPSKHLPTDKHNP